MTPRKEDRIAVIRHIVSQRGKRCRHTFGQIELIKNITLVVPFPRSRNATVRCLMFDFEIVQIFGEIRT